MYNMKEFLSKLEAYVKIITKNEKFILFSMFFFLVLFFIIFTKSVWMSFISSALFFVFYYFFTKLKL